MRQLFCLERCARLISLVELETIKFSFGGTRENRDNIGVVVSHQALELGRHLLLIREVTSGHVALETLETIKFAFGGTRENRDDIGVVVSHQALELGRHLLLIREVTSGHVAMETD